MVVCVYIYTGRFAEKYAPNMKDDELRDFLHLLTYTPEDKLLAILSSALHPPTDLRQNKALTLLLKYICIQHINLQYMSTSIGDDTGTCTSHTDSYT